jgi:hypothetical protein
MLAGGQEGTGAPRDNRKPSEAAAIVAMVVLATAGCSVVARQQPHRPPIRDRQDLTLNVVGCHVLHLHRLAVTLALILRRPG